MSKNKFTSLLEAWLVNLICYHLVKRTNFIDCLNGKIVRDKRQICTLDEIK